VSQASLDPLRAFAARRPDVHVVGIAAQPGARELLAAWAAALDPPFVAAYEPEGRIPAGTSDLGAVRSVPLFVALGPDGAERARHAGLASVEDLEGLFGEP
jgi:hypothetical protein